MIVEFCKWGNGLAMRIPKALADSLKVSNGKRAEKKVENGALVLRPIVKLARKPSVTLDDPGQRFPRRSIGVLRAAMRLGEVGGLLPRQFLS